MKIKGAHIYECPKCHTRVGTDLELDEPPVCRHGANGSVFRKPSPMREVEGVEADRH